MLIIGVMVKILSKDAFYVLKKFLQGLHRDRKALGITEDVK